MGDRNSSQQPAFSHGQQHGDCLPTCNTASPSEDITPGIQQTEAALTEKLTPTQLRAVASWMRAIATTYEHKAPAEVGHSFRAQASHLDHLARQLTPEAGAVIGTLMSSTVAYLMTTTEEYFCQTLSNPDEAEAPPEPCDEATFRKAYSNPDFIVLLGAERLEQCFGPKA